MEALIKFKEGSFSEALDSFFRELNVPVNIIDENPTAPGNVLSNFNPDNKTHQLISDVYAFGMVDDAIFNEIETFDNLEEVKAINEDYDGILIFGVTLHNRENNLLPTRSQLADIARAFNRSFPYTPVVVVFKYQNYIAFANTERTKFIQEWREGEKAGKVSLLRDINLEKTHQGHVRILKSFSVEAIREYDKKNKLKDFAGLYKGWMNVFNTNVLNEQFYKDYQKLSVQIIREIYPKQINDKLKAHQGTLNLLNRMMFIYFIQKKGWVMNDPEFLFHFWQDYQNSGHEQDTFHKCWLNNIFFSAFNGKAFKEPALFRQLPKKYHIPVLNFPYLNGGLFTKNEDLDDFILPDELFERVYNFFQGYIFTISEDTPEEINLEINPELLGKMYEGMINATDLDDVDAEHGIIYTERPEINFMVRRSFIEVLDKKLNNEFSREFLYHLCFDKHSEKLELLRKYKADASVLRKVIMSITSLDPACGSGSILLGVIQLQIELLTAIDEYAGKPHTSKDDFNIKKQIISECIYGVDIKEWAVRIAELRLWLYMITEVELTTDELTQNPLLPNLDFKLRQGNSLLQRIGSREFSLKGLKKGKSNAGAVRKLTRFISKKKAFITNQGETNTSFKKLKEEELFIFKEYIRETIIANNQEIHRMSKGDGQKNIFGYDNQNETIYSERIAELENENRQLNHILSEVNKTGRLPFSYDIDFMEIFLTSSNPGFDMVIGNPPYVRQEDILPADNAVELERLLLAENKAEKTRVSKEYKEILSNKVFELYPFLSTTKGVKTLADKKFKVGGKEKIRQVEKTKQIPVYGKKVPGRSDLYVYFQLICPGLLNNKGTFCFIISNSWLDVEYGGFVQQFLIKHSNLYAIYDCNVRSFSASVNTVIYLHGALINTNLKPDQYKTLLPGNEKVRFIMNKANYTDTAYAPLLIEQEHCPQNTFRKHYRIIVKNHLELWEEGYDEENYIYQSNKWGGKYLRAPEIYFTVLEKGKDKFKPLGIIADVLPGCYAGISDFFYVNDKVIEKFKIEREYLLPLLRNADSINSLEFIHNDWYVISCNQEYDKIKPGLKSYIDWGSSQKTRQRQKTAAGIPYHSTESVKNRKPGWWSIPENNLIPTNLFMQYVGSGRFYCPISNIPVASDRSFHRIFTKNKNLKYILNSSLTWLFVMLIGRSNLGEGALKFEKSDALRLLVYDSNRTFKQNKIFKRNPENIFDEIGLKETLPIRSQKPNPLPDRKALDAVIFDELGLTEEERNEVYWATAELVKQRLDKAASR